MDGLSWSWIALALTLPLLAALLAAVPLWRGNQAILGSVAGTVVLFASAVAFIVREHVALDALAEACLDDGVVCWPDPSAFTRFAIYACIALIQIFALFTLSLLVEERMRRRGYAREWQR